jgi:hypothetical protein
MDDLQSRIRSVIDDVAPVSPDEAVSLEDRRSPSRAERATPWRAAVVGALVVVVLALTTIWIVGRSSSTQVPLGPVGPPPSSTAAPVNVALDLRAAAIAWARTWLTGSPSEIRRSMGRECQSDSRPSKASDLQYLRRIRKEMRRGLGVPLDEVPIADVELRNVRLNQGEAQVLYDLPISRVGNDNWVEYTLRNGRWKVTNCRSPIFGMSSRAASR